MKKRPTPAKKSSNGEKSLDPPRSSPELDVAEPKKVSARERNRQRTYNDIFEAAMSLFVARGYEEVTVDEICEEAGVSKATFFRYFENKYGLVDEFNQRIAQRIDDAIDVEVMSAAACIRVATDTLYEEWLRSAPQVQSLAREFVRSSGGRIAEDLADPMARGLIATLLQVIRSGQENGEFDKNLEASLFAPMIIYAWSLATVAWFDQKDHKGFRRSIHNLVESLISALTHRPMYAGPDLMGWDNP